MLYAQTSSLGGYQRPKGPFAAVETPSRHNRAMSSTETSAAERIRYYVDHREEGRAIAEAGRRRTLTEHTWLDRMGRLTAMMASRLDGRP